MFGTEKVIGPKILRGGWSGFGTALVWIYPNYFGSLCSNPNKIQTNDMVGGVIHFCLRSLMQPRQTFGYFHKLPMRVCYVSSHRPYLFSVPFCVQTISLYVMYLYWLKETTIWFLNSPHTFFAMLAIYVYNKMASAARIPNNGFHNHTRILVGRAKKFNQWVPLPVKGSGGQISWTNRLNCQ